MCCRSICSDLLDCIDDETERVNVVSAIVNSGKEIIEISESQMQRFAGNMLQLQNPEGKKFLVMSQSLTPEQI